MKFLNLQIFFFFYFIGEEEVEPVEVKVSNCNENFCEVKRGTAANMEMTFKSIHKSTLLEGGVKSLVSGTWMRWPIGAASVVCNNLHKGVCPVPANTEATYALDIHIPKFAPVGFKTVVQVRITDQDYNVVACTRFSVHVTG